jgi:RHS repeat-associated protein
VLSVITDARTDSSGYYRPVVVNAQDTYAFGMIEPGRSYAASGAYRYGFQGQEKDDEIKGEGNSVDFTFRVYDPRLGRFLSVDPLTSKYPNNSSYSFQENKLGLGVEFEGLELQPFVTLHSLVEAVYVDRKDPGFWDYVKGYGKLAMGFTPAATMADTYNNMRDYQLNELDYGMNRGRRYEAAIKSGDDPSLVDVQYKFNKASAAIKLAGNGVEWFGLAMGGIEVSASVARSSSVSC